MRISHPNDEQASAKRGDVPAMLNSFLRLSGDDPNHMRGTGWMCGGPSEDSGHPQPRLLHFFSALRSGSIPPWPPGGNLPNIIHRDSDRTTSISSAKAIKRSHKKAVTDIWTRLRYLGGGADGISLSVRGQRVHAEQRAEQMF